jgi:putative ABC transport system substrate-binding protein
MPAPQSPVNLVSQFRNGLSDSGRVEGRDFTVEFRWAAGQDSRLPELVANLISRRVAVIATPGTTQAALAAKAATNTIPIVFSVGVDPVAVGLVSSFNRPRSNATGIFFISSDLTAKRLELLREMMPKATHFAALVDPKGPLSKSTLHDLATGAAGLGLQVEILEAGTAGEIDVALARLAEEPEAALLVSPDALFTNRRAQIGGLAARQRAAIYVDRILRGEKPAELPVQAPTKYELVINLKTASALGLANLKTASALGLAIPPTLLALADDVIE